MSATDAELKAMPDAVYEEVISQDAWEKVRDKWRDDEAWLTEAYNKLKAAKLKAKQTKIT